MNYRRVLFLVVLIVVLGITRNVSASSYSSRTSSAYKSFKESGYELYLYYTSDDLPFYQSIDFDNSNNSEFSRYTARLVTKNNWAWEVNYHHNKVFDTYYSSEEIHEDNEVLCVLFGKDWDLFKNEDFRSKLHLLIGPAFLIAENYVDEDDFSGSTGIEIRTGISCSYKFLVLSLDYTALGSDFELIGNTALGIGFRL